ncbi:MAG: hypothetical protein QOE31_3577 [Solirubrobacteraceae bacterium]|jgi:hypothetical protein|nr:hypothetical protein [Solirubrobacteraceae bacterium]
MSEQFQRPHPNTIACEDCGHIWFEGERRHQYVGPNGEVSEDDDADVVCILCHQKRRRPRPDEEEVTYW